MTGISQSKVSDILRDTDLRPHKTEYWCGKSPDPTQPELPMRSGSPRRLTNTYKRNGTVDLVAALAVHSGEVTARNN